MKNKIQIDNGKLNKFFRSEKAFDNEKELLSALSPFALAPRVCFAKDNRICREYTEGITFARATDGADSTERVCCLTDMLFDYISETEKVLYDRYGKYVVLCDINPRNFIVTADDRIVGIDFESRHFGQREENYISLSAMVNLLAYNDRIDRKAVIEHCDRLLCDNLGGEYRREVEKKIETVIKARKTMKFIRECDGCILAGGKSSRMNYYPKGLLKKDGYPFIRHILYSMQIFDGVYLSANTGDYDFTGLVKLEDSVKDIGPLGGIYTALTASKKQYVFFASCDMPNISQDAIMMLADKMSDGVKCVAARQGDKVYPVFRIYSKDCIPLIEKSIESKNYKLLHILDGCGAVYADIPRQYDLTNVNTKADYEKMKI